MIPGRARVRRLSAASLALSAGALMVFGTPAPAAAAEPKKCVKGHDPETSIADIKCQFHNNVETIKNKIDEANGQKKDDPPKNEGKDQPETKSTKNPAKSDKPKSKPRITPQTSVRSPSNFTVVPPKDLTPRSPDESATDALPEQPQVAGAPQPEQTLALPETRMVEPVAAELPIPGDSERAMWAAGGAAAITAVVMGQFSLIGSRLRRRALQRR
ncbi:hypothetical protein ABGB12_13470 [Actinocorallia sp. B10E7]|uniref:hypothetical protein n=1 Tax=Actinocorallia sp. B10E7 TaxID=3153558 RepID=UPI00325CEF69